MLFSFKSRRKERKEEERKKSLSKMDDVGDDFDLDIDSPIRKIDLKSERKSEGSFDFNLSNAFETDNDSNAPHPPVRSRKTAGWSEDVSSRKSWLRKGSKHFSFKDSPKKGTTVESNVSDVINIPQLDDKEEDLSPEIAKAPSLTVSRIATYQELDSDLSRHTAFQSLDGIDLTLLTKRLLPENSVKKEDEMPWTWDTLIADVSSQLNASISNSECDVPNVDSTNDSFSKLF